MSLSDAEQQDLARLGEGVGGLVAADLVKSRTTSAMEKEKERKAQAFERRLLASAAAQRKIKMKAEVKAKLEKQAIDQFRSGLGWIFCAKHLVKRGVKGYSGETVDWVYIAGELENNPNRVFDKRGNTIKPQSNAFKKAATKLRGELVCKRFPDSAYARKWAEEAEEKEEKAAKRAGDRLKAAKLEATKAAAWLDKKKTAARKVKGKPAYEARYALAKKANTRVREANAKLAEAKKAARDYDLSDSEPEEEEEEEEPDWGPNPDRRADPAADAAHWNDVTMEWDTTGRRVVQTAAGSWNTGDTRDAYHPDSDQD